MQSITIKGSKRESVGKKATKALRNADKVPCVLYGGEQPIHFSADEISFKQLVYTPNVYIASIEMENGDKFNAIVQDLQFHPVTDRLLHVDFYQLHDDKPVTMNIPVKLEGIPVGVRNGGVLRFPSRKLSITALPKDLPDFINVNIEELKIGDKILIGELETEKFKFNQSDKMVVAQVRMARAAITTVVDEDEEGEEGEEGTEGETTETPETSEE
jgi:large subunit ribosomal protein L25